MLISVADPDPYFLGGIGSDHNPDPHPRSAVMGELRQTYVFNNKIPVGGVFSSIPAPKKA